jgi:hypothetical protein
MNPNTNYAALIQGIIGQNQNQADARDRKDLSENQLVENSRQFNVAQTEQEKVNKASIANMTAQTAGQNITNTQSEYTNQKTNSVNGLGHLGDNFAQITDGLASWNAMNWMFQNDTAGVNQAINAVSKVDPRFQQMLQDAGVDGRTTGAGMDENGGYYVTSVQPNGKAIRVPIESGLASYMFDFVQTTLEENKMGIGSLQTMQAGAKFTEDTRQSENAQSQQAWNMSQGQGQQQQPQQQAAQPSAAQPVPPTVQEETPFTVPNIDPKNPMDTGFTSLTKPGANYGVKEQSTQAVVTSPTATAGQKVKVINADPVGTLKTLQGAPDTRLPGRRTTPPGQKNTPEAQQLIDKDFNAVEAEAAITSASKTKIQERVWLAYNRMTNNGLSLKEASNFAMFGSTDINSTKMFMEQVKNNSPVANALAIQSKIVEMNKTRAETEKLVLGNDAASLAHHKNIAAVVAAAIADGPPRDDETPAQLDARVLAVQANINATMNLLASTGMSPEFIKDTFNSPGELAASAKMGTIIFGQLTGGTGNFKTFQGDVVLLGVVAREAGHMGAGQGWFKGMAVDSTATDEIEMFYDLGEELGIPAGVLMAEFVQNKRNGRLTDQSPIPEYIKLRRESK